MSNFTPGPWKMLDTLMGEDGNLIDERYNCVRAGDGYTDEETGCFGFSVSACMSKADARLIAAAPELLDALKKAENEFDRIVRAFPDYVPASFFPDAELRNLIDDVIAKAEGRQ